MDNFKRKVKNCCLQINPLVIGIITVALASGGVGCVAGALAYETGLQNYVDNICNGKQDTNCACNPANNPKEILRVTFGILLGVYLLFLIAGALLIHGARTRRPGLLVPWLVMVVIYFLMDLIVSITCMVVAGTWQVVLIGVSSICLFVLFIYFWTVVLSYRKKLTEYRQIISESIELGSQKQASETNRTYNESMNQSPLL